MVEQGTGAIISIGSVMGLFPEYLHGIYGATKSYVMTLTQSMHAEVADKRIYVQAVLPAATRTEIYDRSGGDISKVPASWKPRTSSTRRWSVSIVTIPPVPDAADWMPSSWHA